MSDGRMPTPSEQEALNRLADAVNEIGDGLSGLHQRIRGIHNKLGGPSGVPVIALVKEDGTEDPERIPWTGTHLDAEAAAIVGDSVRFKPGPGTYVGWCVYSESGRRLGGGELGQRAKVRRGGTITLADLSIHLTMAAADA